MLISVLMELKVKAENVFNELEFMINFRVCMEALPLTLHRRWNFPLGVSSVNWPSP